MSSVKRGILIATCACALVIIGHMDYSDTQDQQDTYCQQVAKGVWPNYNHDIKCPAADAGSKE